MPQPICRHCAAGVQLFNCIKTYLPALCFRAPGCLSCVATYLPGTVLQGCSCLSRVATYLPALCCSGAAVYAVSKPICRHCVAGVQLFKQCRNLTAGHCAAVVQLLKRCPNLSAGTVLQGCSCISGVKTYLGGLCCRGAAV